MCCEDDIRSFHSGVFAYNLYLSDAWFVEFILINILVAPFAIPKKHVHCEISWTRFSSNKRWLAEYSSQSNESTEIKTLKAAKTWKMSINNSKTERFNFNWHKWPSSMACWLPMTRKRQPHSEKWSVLYHSMVHSCATVVDCLALINTLIWVCICLRVFSPFIHPFKHLISLKRFTKLNVRKLSLSLLKVKNPIEYFGIHWDKSQHEAESKGGKFQKNHFDIYFICFSYPETICTKEVNI